MATGVYPPIPTTVPLGRYLWDRIAECGTKTVMSVPGDFQLHLLDYVYAANLHLIGNSNELNAAYAADGYSRAARVPGCVVTTHGVGELSAINGIAGAAAECVPVIHVVGQPARRLWKAKANVHHALGLGSDYGVYTRTSAPISAATAQLWDPTTAPADIDRVLQTCLHASRPVYIYVPLDIVHDPVSVPNAALTLTPSINSDAETSAAAAIVAALSEAKAPCVLLDALVDKRNVVKEAEAVVEKLGVPVFGTLCAKGWVDEGSELFAGTYTGAQSPEGVRAKWESCDFALVVGDWHTDANSGGFTRKVVVERSACVNENDVVVRGVKYSNTNLKSLLTHLATVIPSLNHLTTASKTPLNPHAPVVNPSSPDAPTASSWIWYRIARFLRAGDIIVSDVGTSQFALVVPQWPRGTRHVSQTFYGSIGWAFAATLGVDRALEEKWVANGKKGKRGRAVCITGDGAMALSIQEAGTMIWEGLRPVVLLVNNFGYLVERVIHGPNQRYNDIAPTDYSHLLPLYKHPKPESSYHVIKTSREAEDVFEKSEVSNAETLQLVEMVHDRMDVPEMVTKLLEQFGGARGS